MSDEQATDKILVIDDEQSTLTMLRLLLGAYGYRVLTADGGEKGLDIFRRESPPIVLTDIRMPGMDGIEVLKRLKQADPRVEVIVVTGHGDMDLAILALRNDASDFLNKPVRKEALEVALRRAKERIHLKRQLRDYTCNLEAKVEAATAELDKSCRQLETLYQLSQSVGETVSLDGILDLLHERIQALTSLTCRALLVLSTHGDTLLPCRRDPEGMRVTDQDIACLKDLKAGRPLSDAESKHWLGSTAETGPARVLMLPISREGEPPAGAAIIQISAEARQEELRLVELFLSQAAGAIRRAVAQEEEVRALRHMAEVRQSFGDMIGSHEKMAQVYELVTAIADSDATVLIQGESGTGKELIARRIHDLSGRRKGPFVAISCAAFPQTLLEAELFGYEKGAFTGAVHSRRGSFELAHGGTLFLDEIGEVPPASQVKLLRVIQFKEFQRVGSEASTRVDVRVLAATSRNLRVEMDKGSFREDLYYRLHVIPIMLPPLRERMSDLPLLAGHFLRRLSNRSEKKITEIGPAAMRALMGHHWPGNVRELENVMEHSFILARSGSIQLGDLPAYLQESSQLPSFGAEGGRQADGEGLDEMEKRHLIRVLDQCRGNKIQAARRLKISRSTLYRKLEAYGIHD